MKLNHEELYRRLSSLKENFSKLSQRLEQTRQELETLGMPPTEDFVAALSASRNEFADLRDSVLAQTDSLPSSSLPKPGEVVSLKNLESLLQAVTETEKKKAVMEEVRQRALEILDRVLMLVHCDGIDFSPLSECQAKARELQRAITDLQWPDLNPDLEAVAESKHPFAQLLTFVEKGDELDNDSWGFLQDAVAQAFGKPLAVAVSRRKLIISSESARHAIAAEPVPIVETKPDEPAAAPQAPLETTPDDENRLTAQESILEETKIVEEEISESLQTSEKSEPAAETLAAEPPAFERETPDEAYPHEPAEEPLNKPLCYFSPHDTAQKIAVSILNTRIEDRAENLRDLVWRLILDDKLGIAYHLNNCLENIYPDLYPRLPSWLIHVAVLSGHLRHENGEIGRLLKDDFSKFNNDCFSTKHFAEWNYAARFLLIAAALRPALLTPITGATAILHALTREDIKQQLFEYCQIMAKNIQSLDAITLKQVRNQAAWQGELKALQDEAEKWSLQAPQKSMEFAHATFVWQHWQKTGGVVHSLLLYIKQNDSKKVPAAKKEVERWSDEKEIRDAVNYTDRKVLERRRGADITSDAFKQICRHLREAVRLVRRWIDLQASGRDKRRIFLKRARSKYANKFGRATKLYSASLITPRKAIRLYLFRAAFSAVAAPWKTFGFFLIRRRRCQMKSLSRGICFMPICSKLPCP